MALIFGEQRWTYRELNNLVGQMAGQLATAGVERGQHVAVLMPNRPEYVGLIHALARLEAVLVPLNIRLTPQELRWQIQQADCAYLICSVETETQAAALINDVRRVLAVDSTREAGIQSLAEFSSGPMIEGQPLNLETRQSIIFTSGTTGQPKGAMLTFGNHLWSAVASAFKLGTQPADRWLLCLPLYHVGGIAIVFRCCLYGVTVVLQSGFEPEAIGYALDNQHVTLISLVPTMLHRLLESHRASLVASKLRCILLGGAAAPSSLLEQCLALGLPVALTYGLTEAASQVVTATPTETMAEPGSVGKPLMFSQVQIVDEAGQTLPPGEIGEIVVSGPTVMQGYYNQPEATQKALHQGRLHTGDLGYLDGEGKLWVMQRRADLIVSGGENIYPVEVERVLARYPGVADVCVVGLDDAEWGQQVAAAVVVNNGATITEQALVNFCREQLAGYKQPRLIRFVGSLPRTASGKVQRDKVKELFGSELKSSELKSFEFGELKKGCDPC
jgi:O-succinylbenzoic acid--CoA ligase